MTLYLHDMFDMNLFDEMRSSGFVKVQRHSEFPNELAIANYTQKAQINYHWNEVTTQCRGLIFNPQTEEVLERPFAKFYNFDEKQADKIEGHEKVMAFDKLDGSLGVIYTRPDDTRAIATRGSFTSDQALHATKLLEKYVWNLHSNHTMLFEIIYPENRIVVNYDDMDELVYLGEVLNDNGVFVYEPKNFSGNHTQMLYEGTFAELFTVPERKGQEGYVVRTHDGRAVKVKYEEYVHLHRIVTRLSERSIWEMMAGPYGDIDELVAQLPEEHANWARTVAHRLNAEYITVHLKVSEIMMQHRHYERSRKDTALAIKDEPGVVKAAVFKALDGKRYRDVVWKALYPKGNKDDDK